MANSTTLDTQAAVPKKETKGEMFRSLIFAVALALIFRSFAFEPFYIPSGSMKSTLLIGDYVFVSKFNYGFSRHSLPLGIPLIKGRIFRTEPTRGDVIVFKLPSSIATNYIKRLIGLPGDHIQVRDGIVYINGTALPRKRIENFMDYDEEGNVTSIPQYVETLPNGVSYHVLDQDSHGKLDNTDVYVVPEGHYFMMGDNRDNSQDSRVLDFVGYVPEENLLGPAKWIFFSASDSFWKFWKWPFSLRFRRFFSFVQIDE